MANASTTTKSSQRPSQATRPAGAGLGGLRVEKLKAPPSDQEGAPYKVRPASKDAPVFSSQPSISSDCPIAPLARRFGVLAKEYMSIIKATDEAIERRHELIEEMRAIETLCSFEQARSAIGAIFQLIVTWNRIEQLDELAATDKYLEGTAARAGARRLLSSVISYIEQVSDVSANEVGREYAQL